MTAERVPRLDEASLAGRARSALAPRFGQVDVVDVARLAGGSSSLTYAATVRGAPGIERVVVKVAPPGLEPVRNRDVLRQARLLDALAGGAGLALPTVLGTDGGAPPEVPPLFVMTFAEGDSFEPLLSDDDAAPSDEDVEARGRSAARMLAALHAGEPGALADEPVRSPADEVARWAKALTTVDLDIVPSRTWRCRDRLLDAVPAALPATIVHGDWRLGNMLSTGRTINAIIDWELWAVSDPRTDLAWFLAFADPDRPGSTRAESALPSVAALLAEYESIIGRPTPDLGWFHALVRFKMAATSALIAKNDRRRADHDPRAEGLGRLVPDMIDEAMAWLEKT